MKDSTYYTEVLNILQTCIHLWTDKEMVEHLIRLREETQKRIKDGQE